ncbi:MAG: family 16 glycosylhydrolase [Prevotellaceae bacterium]|jgi:hypothetical protein|nr:family 16 glycosylhydrolase [Prevotellaceae bacterium]
MVGFFKRLRFHLSGGIPGVSKYEARRAALARKYEKYLSLKQTPNLLRYRELALQIATPRRQSGLSKKEWGKMKREFAGLRKSADVVDFFKLQKSSNNFSEITRWKLVFEDSFGGTALDKAKWITHPAPVGATLKTLYSPSDENHLYTDGDNLAVANQTLKILVKREHAHGVGFSGQVGFAPIEREYTSGIVNTAQSYTQQYGKVEAKIRFGKLEKGVYHSVWLGAGKMLPHVNVLRIGAEVEFSVFAEQKSGEVLRYVETWKRSLLRQNTGYIVAVEWSKERMTWKINGVELFSAPNIVDEPVYIALSSGVVGKPKLLAPAALEVSWVKAYEHQA